MNIHSFLTQSLTQNQFHLSTVVEEKIVLYLELLQRWNRVFNLTSIRDPQQMVILHILDSLAVIPFLQGPHIIDVGSGAGLPGIPLALVNPDKQFVLLDSNHKKTRFLTQVVADLKIQNVHVVHARCEDFKPEQCFNQVLSRAFASLKTMLEGTQHLICQDGQFLAMKGIVPDEEIAEIPHGFAVLGVHKLTIQGLEGERCVVLLTKT